MISLKEPKVISNGPIHPLHVKQGTPEWFALREKAIFTGSTLYKGLGLFKFKDQVSFLKEKAAIVEKVQFGTKSSHVSTEKDGGNDAMDTADEQEASCDQEEATNSCENVDISREKFLEWGRNNEKHAVATVISYALPMFYPGTSFLEVGASFIQCEITNENLVEVSADGLICTEDEVTAKVEIKCPYPPAEGMYKLPVYYDVPRYYALQLIVEMEAEPKVPEILFACYSPQSTVLSKVKFNNDLWLSTKIEIKNLLTMISEGTIPKQRTLFAKDVLPQKIQQFLETNVEVLMEIPSVKDTEEGTCFSIDVHNENTPYIIPKEMNDELFKLDGYQLKQFANQFGVVLEKGYEISRLKAKELFVCLLAPATRTYHPEKPSCFPVFYGLKGKTFSRTEKRRLYDTVMDACSEHEIDILATSFDGECVSLITENEDGDPLTLIQLQHDVYESTRKVGKQEIVREIVNISKTVLTDEIKKRLREKYHESGKIMLEGLPLPKSPCVELRKAIAENEKGKKKRKNAGDSQSAATRNKSKKKSGKQNKGISKKLLNPKSLAQLSRAVVESPTYYKSALNISYAKIIWPSKLEKWKEDSPITHGLLGQPDTWFCIPEFSKQRRRLEHKVWDATHLLTNMRRVVCSKGTEKLSKEAWIAASKDKMNSLKPSMVLDLPDKQDIGFALTTFSEEVEISMTKMNFCEEATFCRLIREWWTAEDEPGISAVQRVSQRNNLRQYLLKDVDFGSFPPFTSYVKGLYVFHCI